MNPISMFFPVLVQTLSAITGGSSMSTLQLDRCKALSDRRGPNGTVLKVAALLLHGTIRQTSTAATQDGIVPGKRVAELVKVEYKPKGWGLPWATKASCRATRRFAIHEGGIATRFVVDSADIADADGTDTDHDVIYPLALFWRNSFRKKDFGPHASVCQTDLGLEIVSGSHIDGISAVSLVSGARVIAVCYWGKEGEVPQYTMIREQAVTADLPGPFGLPIEAERCRRAYLMVDGSQGVATATTHLAGSFTESVTVELDGQGGRLTDKIRIDEQVSLLNATMADAAANESLTVPEVLPIFWPEQGAKNTQVMTGKPTLTLSADPRDTATGTSVAVNLVTDECQPAREGGPGTAEYKRTIGHPDASIVHRVTASKVQRVAESKKGALPAMLGK